MRTQEGQIRHNETWEVKNEHNGHETRDCQNKADNRRQHIDMNFTGDTGMRQKRTKNLTNKKP